VATAPGNGQPSASCADETSRNNYTIWGRKL
jgi:hypothetical protein